MLTVLSNLVIGFGAGHALDRRVAELAALHAASVRRAEADGRRAEDRRADVTIRQGAVKILERLVQSPSLDEDFKRYIVKEYSDLAVLSSLGAQMLLDAARAVDAARAEAEADALDQGRRTARTRWTGAVHDGVLQSLETMATGPWLDEPELRRVAAAEAVRLRAELRGPTRDGVQAAQNPSRD